MEKQKLVQEEYVRGSIFVTLLSQIFVRGSDSIQQEVQRVIPVPRLRRESSPYRLFKRDVKGGGRSLLSDKRVNARKEKSEGRNDWDRIQLAHSLSVRTHVGDRRVYTEGRGDTSPKKT